MFFSCCIWQISWARNLNSLHCRAKVTLATFTQLAQHTRHSLSLWRKLLPCMVCWLSCLCEHTMVLSIKISWVSRDSLFKLLTLTEFIQTEMRLSAPGMQLNCFNKICATIDLQSLLLYGKGQLKFLVLLFWESELQRTSWMLLLCYQEQFLQSSNVRYTSKPGSSSKTGDILKQAHRWPC